MKFLLNMNLPRELGRKLAALGHEWRHVADIGMTRAADADILTLETVDKCGKEDPSLRVGPSLALRMAEKEAFCCHSERRLPE